MSTIALVLAIIFSELRVVTILFIGIARIVKSTSVDELLVLIPKLKALSTEVGLISVP